MIIDKQDDGEIQRQLTRQNRYDGKWMAFHTLNSVESDHVIVSMDQIRRLISLDLKNISIHAHIYTACAKVMLLHNQIRQYFREESLFLTSIRFSSHTS